MTIKILYEVASVANAEGIDHMLVGATARDVLLTNVFDLEPRSATHDVDFAVAVRDWDQFEALRAGLLARKTFKDAGKVKQRLYYKGEEEEYDYQIDLVPFGAVTNGTDEVAWPPDLKTIMNVAGYEDVLAAAELVEVSPGFVQKVVSIAGLAILKIVAWSDRGRDDPKDAQDLIYVMDNYAVAGNFDRVYEENGVIEAGNYDPDVAGIYLLGLDIQRMASENTLDIIKQIIEQNFDRLSTDMIKSQRHFENVEERVASRLRLLQRALSSE
jgi:predicted nucleotidyltransferase